MMIQEHYHSAIPDAFMPFRHSAILPFRNSAIPQFRLSAFPPFRLSAFPPFRLSAFPLPFRLWNHQYEHDNLT
jgi:hypothetical protein